MADEQLNAAQINAVAKYQTELTSRVMANIELRKLALDQACKLVSASSVAQDGQVTFRDPVALAKAMHEFLTAPTAAAQE